jgi:hypothetical protein
MGKITLSSTESRFWTAVRWIRATITARDDGPPWRPRDARSPFLIQNAEVVSNPIRTFSWIFARVGGNFTIIGG